MIDATKASTTGTAALESTPPAEEAKSVPSIQVDEPTKDTGAQGDTEPLSISVPEESGALLADSVVEEGVLGLSGVGAFSPAPSEPPSPTLSRRDLHQQLQGPKLHPLTPLTRLDGSDTSLSSLEMKYAGDEGGESEGEGESVRLRKRARPLEGDAS